MCLFSVHVMRLYGQLFSYASFEFPTNKDLHAVLSENMHRVHFPVMANCCSILCMEESEAKTKCQDPTIM